MQALLENGYFSVIHWKASYSHSTLSKMFYWEILQHVQLTLQSFFSCHFTFSVIHWKSSYMISQHYPNLSSEILQHPTTLEAHCSSRFTDCSADSWGIGMQNHTTKGQIVHLPSVSTLFRHPFDPNQKIQFSPIVIHSLFRSVLEQSLI